MNSALPRFAALDRDGTIIEHVHHLSRIEDIRLIPGAASAIRNLNHLSIPVFVVTNQSVVGRGLITGVQLNEIHEHLIALLAEEGARVDEILFCPHLPDDNCVCRKPRPGLLREAAKHAGAPVNSGIVMGDSRGDIEMALCVGARAIHVQTGVDPTVPSTFHVLSAVDLDEAIRVILGSV